MHLQNIWVRDVWFTHPYIVIDSRQRRHFPYKNPNRTCDAPACIPSTRTHSSVMLPHGFNRRPQFAPFSKLPGTFTGAVSS